MCMHVQCTCTQPKYIHYYSRVYLNLRELLAPALMISTGVELQSSLGYIALLQFLTTLQKKIMYTNMIVHFKLTDMYYIFIFTTIILLSVIVIIVSFKFTSITYSTHIICKCSQDTRLECTCEGKYQVMCSLCVSAHT